MSDAPKDLHHREKAMDAAALTGAIIVALLCILAAIGTWPDVGGIVALGLVGGGIIAALYYTILWWIS